jgi:hypothetical protein
MQVLFQEEILMKTTTNALLTVIAVCLLLMTAKLYDVNLLPGAYAQWRGETLATGKEVIPVAIYAKHANGQWYPCQISDGDKLIVEIQR